MTVCDSQETLTWRGRSIEIFMDE